MVRDVITLRLRRPEAQSDACPLACAIAGHLVWIDAPSADLSPFELAGTVPMPMEVEYGPDEGVVLAQVYSGRALVAREERQVDCRASAQGYWLTVEGVGEFTISGDGGRIRLVQHCPSALPQELVETAFGPALILALAIRGTFCLHASAIEIDGGAIAFVGESGIGKSYLARYLDAADSRWPRLADDILPLSVDDAIWTLPRYPQLKLPPESQPSLRGPERLPLRLIYLIAPPDKSVASVPLDGAAGLLAVVRHSVASRLFDRELSGQHLRFAAAVADRVGVRRLNYPRGHRALDEVRTLIESDLGISPERPAPASFFTEGSADA